MSWNEIIAEIDAEIARLQRARDFLAGAPTLFKTALSVPTTKKAPAAARKKASKPQAAKQTAAAKKRTQPKRQLTIPFVSETPTPETAAPTAPPLEKEASQPTPQVRLLPPKRRFERRPAPRRATPEKAGKQPAALAGTVPSGPVVVSADEARKAQERNANVPSTETPAPPPVEAPSSASSERTLASLIQAFERSNRLNRVGTP